MQVLYGHFFTLLVAFFSLQSSPYTYRVSIFTVVKIVVKIGLFIHSALVEDLLRNKPKRSTSVPVHVTERLNACSLLTLTCLQLHNSHCGHNICWIVDFGVTLATDSDYCLGQTPT